MDKMKAKKLGSGNVFLRGVVIFDNHIDGQVNQFNGYTEYSVGIKIMNDDKLSAKSLSDFVKMMGLSQNDANSIFKQDDEGITFFSKSRKAISVIDIDNQIVDDVSLIGCKVVIALNVTIWQYGNTANIGIYCNGLKVLEKAETKTIFDIFSTSQSQIYVDDTKTAQLSDSVKNKSQAQLGDMFEPQQVEIGNLNDYENIIADDKNIPF